MAKAKSENFYFYDTLGNSVTLARAKHYVIEFIPKGARKKVYLIGEFPRVKESVFNKEIILLDMMLARNLRQLKKPKVDPASYKAFTKSREILQEVAQTFIEEIAEDDPKLAKEIEKAYIDELIEEELEDQFFLDEFKGSIEREDKIIYSKRLEKSAYIENFYYNFVKPYRIKEPDFDKVVALAKIAFKESLTNILDDMATRGLDGFIFRVNYRFKIGNTDHFDVIPLPRSFFKRGLTGDQLSEQILNNLELSKEIGGKFAEYLKRDVMGGAISILGYTLENLYETE